MRTGTDEDIGVDDVEARLEAALHRLAEAHIPEQSAARPQRRSWRPLAVAAAAVIVLCGGVGLVAVMRNAPAPSTQPDLPQSTDDPAAQDVVGSPSPGPGGDAIAWTIVESDSSIVRSTLHGLVGGPTGFVATGEGFDNAQNQGRVWFSADGVTWEEPAFETFDDKVVGAPAWTSDAFYLVAAPNTDRSQGEPTEADPTRDDAFLYRSVDGRTWTPIGDAWDELENLATAGDVLLRTRRPSEIETSRDGVTWTPANFTDPPDTDRLFDLMVTTGDRFYMRTFEDERFQIWASTDGITWERLPAPPRGGYLAEINGVLILITNPREFECRTAELTGSASTPSLDAVVNSQWSCVSEMETYRLDNDLQEWIQIIGHGPGPSPQLPPIAILGSTIVAAVLDSDGNMTMWTSRAGNTDWQPVGATTVNLSRQGSPSTAQIATNDEKVVVATRNGGGETTKLVVGTLRT